MHCIHLFYPPLTHTHPFFTPHPTHPHPKSSGAMLSQRHAAERLQTCWRGGGLSLEDVRKQMRDALDEFMVAGSGSEVAAVSVMCSV